jgi:SAM-dependent methyltransferase
MTSTAYSQFDGLATLYEDMANWPFRRDIEIPGVLEVVGDVAGRDILDFGCGDGTYCRILKGNGARRVVGFDKASGMLQHARGRERNERLGIQFVSKLGSDLDRQFDLVLGVYVLPYAVDKEELERMCIHMRRLLRPGGRLVTLPIHPEYAPDPAYYEPYGFSLTQVPPHRNGGDVRLDLFYPGHDETVTARYWSTTVLDSALHDAGFEEIVRRNPAPSALMPVDQAPELLRAYLSRPHAVILQCR